MVRKTVSCIVVVVCMCFCDAAVTAAPVPTPIGFGRKYLVPAASAQVERAAPVGRFRCDARSGPRQEAHVELFADRRALLLPPGIGMAPPLRRQGAEVTEARCSYALRTTAPTGVVQFLASEHPTLRDLFAIWGQPLGPDRLAGFRGRVSAFVAGKPYRGDVAAIPLTRHEEVVLEIGGYIPPHSFFLFPTS
jgi:hypothetical protein